MWSCFCPQMRLYETNAAGLAGGANDSWLVQHVVCTDVHKLFSQPQLQVGTAACVASWCNELCHRVERASKLSR